MDAKKRAKLEAKGWKVGSVADFLELSVEEAEYIEIKIAFGKKLAEQRKHKKLTQAQLAKKIHTSQSRVAKMEKGDPSVTIDRIIRSLLALGNKKDELVKII